MSSGPLNPLILWIDAAKRSPRQEYIIFQHLISAAPNENHGLRPRQQNPISRRSVREESHPRRFPEFALPIGRFASDAIAESLPERIDQPVADPRPNGFTRRASGDRGSAEFRPKFVPPAFASRAAQPRFGAIPPMQVPPASRPGLPPHDRRKSACNRANLREPYACGVAKEESRPCGNAFAEISDRGRGARHRRDCARRRTGVSAATASRRRTPADA